MIEVYCTDKDGNLVERLTQWDVDQYILIGGSGLIEAPKIHFCNAVSDEALVVGSEMEGDLIKAKIPNILLQDKYLIMAYLYVYDPTVSSISAMTKATIKIPILPRQKPSNYPYVENIDYISATSLEAKIEKEIEDLANELNENYNQTLSRIETSLETEYKSTTNAIREEYGDYFNQMKDEHSSMVSDYEGIKVDYNLLSSDLREISSDLRETDSQLKELSANIRSDMNDLEESYSETTTNLENRYSETIDDLVSKFSDGSPKGYFSNVEDLSGKVAGVYINDADGYVYYWDGETISDAITRYEYTADTDVLNNHIANKKEPHIQRISLGGTSFEDIINGTYTGLDGDDYITEGDMKRFYLTNIGWGNDCVELIVSGNRIDSGCIQVINVYRAYNVICKQYYRIKSGMSWTEWKLAEDFDEELNATSTNAVQNKVVATEINDVKTALDSKAPNSHASTSTTYGMGTETNYGHVKVVNNLTSTLKSGAALSPFQGRLLKYAVDAIPAETMNGTYEIKPDGTTQSGTLGVRIGDRRNRKWINGFNYTEGNVATGDYSVAMGRGNTVTGLGALSIGTSNFCDGGNSFVWGFSNNANGANSFVGGGFNTAKNNQLKIGWCAKDGNGNNGGGTGGDAFIIGNGNYSIVQEDGTSDYANPTLTQSNAFRVAYNGSVYGGAAYNSSGADIAELYEWQDGNPEGEDRRGLFVTLDGTKIRLANEDDTYIKGAISARPCLVGDSASEDWHGKYMTDVFGALLTQTVHHDAIYKGVEKIDPETGEKKVEKELVSEEYDSVEFILNPEYNDEEEYIPREKRPEYDYVSSWGKIVLVDDGSCEVNGFAKPGKAGKATKSEEQTIYRVMKRIDENHIFVAVG